MKILHYCAVYAPAWKWGGPPRSVANLCEGLTELGHEVTVFTTNAGLEGDPAIPIDRALVRNGVVVNYFASSFNALGLQSTGLENAVRTRVREFDLVHVTGVWQPTSVAACRAAEAARVPYVVSPRGALGRYSFTQKPWKKWLYWWLRERRNCARASGIHCTSTLEADECSRFGLRSRTFVVPNSIDLDTWRRDEPGGHEWRRAIGCADDERVFLYVGRLHHKKGLDLLPAVLASLRDRAWRMVFVGADEDGTGAEVRAAFAGAGLADRVTFQPDAGAPELVRAYSGADLFLFPSRHENFGNVAVEALACGCPVLLSDLVGAADELADISGVSIAPRTVEAWATTIRQHLDTLSRPGSLATRSAVEERFSTAAVARRMAEAYSNLRHND